MPESLMPLFLLVLIFTFIVILIMKYWYVKVPPGYALIINSLGKLKVFFSGGRLVLPYVEMSSLIDITPKTFEITCQGDKAFISKDHYRVDITISFTLGFKNTEQDVLYLSKYIGVERLSGPTVLKAFLGPKLIEKIMDCAIHQYFEDIYHKPDIFVAQIREACLKDLPPAFDVKSVSMVSINLTPLSKLDKNNIFDVDHINNFLESSFEFKLKYSQPVDY